MGAVDCLCHIGLFRSSIKLLDEYLELYRSECGQLSIEAVVVQRYLGAVLTDCGMWDQAMDVLME
jgi:hypothetical protein